MPGNAIKSLLAARLAASAAWWTPEAGTTFNINLIGTPTTFSPASRTLAYDLDLFNTANSTIADLHADGHKVICYYSAGTYEPNRDDSGDFPEEAKGKPLPDYPEERWLDTTNTHVRDIMAARTRLAAAKGCDAVDPDNVDAYDNDSGFDKLSTDTAADYVKFLAGEAHAVNLAAGLKNAGSIIPDVLSSVDFCVNEQCAQFEECETFRPFIDANKPVFEIEYTDAEDEEQLTPTPEFLQQSCVDGDNEGFSLLLKNLSLDDTTFVCPDGQQVPFRR